MLVMLKEGNLKAVVDFEDYVCSAPCLLLIFPEQVHQLIPQTRLSGWSVSFDAALISEDQRNTLERNWRDRAPFLQDVPAAWFKQIDVLLTTISLLYENPLITSRNAITALLNGAVYIITGILSGTSAETNNKKGRTAQIKQLFINLL